MKTKRAAKRKEHLTETKVRALKGADKPYRVWDAKTHGLYVHVWPDGKRIFRYYYSKDGRPREITIGQYDPMTLTLAREKVAIYQGELVKDVDPLEKKAAARQQAKREKVSTLQAYLDGPFSVWAGANHKPSTQNIKRIKSAFPEWLDRDMTKITPWAMTGWIRKRRVTAATIQRDYNAIQGVLSRAVEDGILDKHPLEDHDGPPGVIEDERVRYLSPKEEIRLRDALAARDDDLREGRASANKWRKQRGYELLPPIATYGDYLSPLVLTALNTGCRRGELFSLTWDRVNFHTRTLTVSAHTSKSSKTRHIPLNDDALMVLRAWGRGDGLVFPNPDTGEQLTTIKTAWKRLMKLGKIKDFRLHDCRHHFASRLVMGGVDLYTVSKLMGHSSIKMTERYAHLAPDHLQNAVSVLTVANR